MCSCTCQTTPAVAGQKITEAVSDLFPDGAVVTVREIAQAYGQNEANVLRQINRARANGLVEEVTGYRVVR